MNYPTQPHTLIAGVGGMSLPKLDKPASEIERELIGLEAAIQETFERSQDLSKRLQPILSNYPQPPQDQNKNLEESLTDLGSKLRQNRRSIEAINVTLSEIQNRIAL